MDQTGGSELKERIGAAGTAVKDGVIGTLKGIYQVENELLSVVRNTVADTLKATGRRHRGD